MKRICLVVIILGFLLSGCWIWPFGKKSETPPQPLDWDKYGYTDLMNRLYSEDPEIRALAADRLVARGDKRAVRGLSTVLRESPDPIVNSVLKVLALRPDERYTPALIDILESRNSAFHILIFEVFKYYERDGLSDELLYRVKQKEKTLKAKQNIVMALGKVRSKKSVEPLIRLFGSEEGNLNNQVNDALTQITLQRFSVKEEWLEWWSVYKDKPREVWLDEALINYQKLLNDKNSKIDELTAELVSLKIDLLNTKLEQVRKLQADGVLPILTASLNDKLWQIRKYVIEQLGLLPKDKLKEVLPKLLELTGAPEEDLRNAVIITLGESGDETVMTPLINILNNPKESIPVRKTAAFALGKIGNPQASIALINALKETSVPLLLAVIEALGKIKDKSCLLTLTTCLNDKEKPGEVQRAIIDVMGEIKDPSCISVIITFTDDSRDRFRWSAANSLGKIGSEAAVAPLIKLLKDEFADIRQISVEALGNIGSENAAQPLINTLLNDKDPRVRELSAIALGKIKSKQTVPSLIHSLTDQNERVANAGWNSILGIICGDINLMEETVKQLEEAKNYSRAGEIYKKITEMSDKPEYIKALIRYLKESNKIDDVIKSYNLLLSKLPQNSQEWWDSKTELVNFLYDKKEYAKCLEEIKGLLDNNSITPVIKEQLEHLKAECEKVLSH